MNIATKDAINEFRTNSVAGSATGLHPETLTEVYRDDVNIAVWRRSLSCELHNAVKDLLEAQPNLRVITTLSASSIKTELSDALPLASEHHSLLDDVSELIDMYCLLFNLDKVGLRLTTLMKQMCPKFHTDHVTCRLITTYSGPATEWVEHGNLSTKAVLARVNGNADSASASSCSSDDIQQVSTGDVALLKGSRWQGGFDNAIVHRSPKVNTPDPRLILTLDFA